MIVYFIRHGESFVNLTNEFSHKKNDKSLTSKGRQQVLQLAQYIKKINYSTVYTSPLKRAIETARVISQYKKISLKIMEAFREINVGALESKPPSEKTWNYYFDVQNSWKSGDTKRRYPQGENKDELLKRFTDGLKMIMIENQNSKEPVVIVGHGGIFIISLAEILENVGRDFFSNKHWHNCGITTCEVNMVGERITGTLIDYGNTSFLTGNAAKLVHGTPKFENR